MKNNKQRPAIKEFDIGWKEYFKDKPKPKNDEEEKKQLEEFHHWYNYIRKQSDTGKTPAEMYKEIYRKDSPKSPSEVSRMMNFEWDEDYDENYFEENEDDEQELKEITKISDTIFENGVWQNSKEEVKEMSRRDSSKHMFRLGFFLYSKYMHQQMKDIAEELRTMSEEDIEKMIDNFKRESRENDENKD